MNNRITIYSARCRGKASNCIYPDKHVITNVEELAKAVTKDNVCAKYRGDYRTNDNFISSDCMPFDCDNDHSDDPEDWVTPEDVQNAFPGVPFYVIYSRSHERYKKGQTPRPRFHVYFPIDEIKSLEDYTALKQSVISFFPYFDKNAKDGARFFFGVEDPKVVFYGGDVREAK